VMDEVPDDSRSGLIMPSHSPAGSGVATPGRLQFMSR
jgi:hypothetical protein